MSVSKMGHQDQAVDLYKQAITLFQRANDLEGEMQTCDLLATAERQRNHLTAAEGWYARSRELALHLNNRPHQAVVAQNLGILYQTRAGNAPDDNTRVAFLRQAVASVEESLTIALEMGNQVGAASSYMELGKTYRLLDEYDQAETYLHQGLQIHEYLNLPDVYKSYWNLAKFAEARGDAAAAAQWQAKYEAKWAEIERLQRGSGAGERGSEGAGGQDKQLVEFVLAVAQGAYDARQSGVIEPELAEALAQMAAAPPPFGEMGGFLQAVASGEALPPLPPGLPEPFAGFLAQLVEAVEG